MFKMTVTVIILLTTLFCVKESSNYDYNVRSKKYEKVVADALELTDIEELKMLPAMLIRPIIAGMGSIDGKFYHKNEEYLGEINKTYMQIGDNIYRYAYICSGLNADEDLLLVIVSSKGDTFIFQDTSRDLRKYGDILMQLISADGHHMKLILK